VVAQALRVLEVVSSALSDVELRLESRNFGGCAIDATGEPLPESTLRACKEADAILMGKLFLNLSSNESKLCHA
jgi:3-isopropylmalate dehydrogenase